VQFLRANRFKRIQTLKMTLKFIQPYMRYVSAVICLLVVFNNCGVVVLCIGEDGHVAIETTGSSCCVATCSTISKGDATWFIEDSGPASDDCGSCVDIPLSGGIAGSVTVAKKANVWSCVPTPVSALPAASPQKSKLKPAVKSIELTPFFTPLRSVILLT
jgi:hypothetical protein